MMKDYPVKVGSMLLTMVDPHRGHEVEYNRWYERDHFYAGCLVGPWLFAGRRWVAPKPLKLVRFPEDSTLAKPTVRAGSYVAIYWIHADHHQEHHAWSNKQAHWLYQNGRGFNERTHVHTIMYTLDWTLYRDADPVPVELALDHGYPGMVTFAIERNAGVSQEQFDAWWREKHLPGFLANSPVASCVTWSPIPQGNAPMVIPKVERTEALDMHLFFLDTDPLLAWCRFERLGQEVAASGMARVVFASPWLPTIVGTNAYTDQLW
jgi:hypothetical protein